MVTYLYQGQASILGRFRQNYMRYGPERLSSQYRFFTFKYKPWPSGMALGFFVSCENRRLSLVHGPVA
jgi:hypothetical protein